MFGYYLKSVFRNLWKKRLFPVINIVGLAFAFAAVLLILLWVIHQFRYDSFHENSDNIYRVAHRQQYTDSHDDIVLTPGPLAPTIKEYFPSVTHATRFQQMDRMMVEAEGQQFISRFAMADADFFLIFSFPFIEGNPQQCFDNPESIVLSRKAAEKYFGSASEAYGKQLIIDDRFPLTVTGIIEDIPGFSHLQFELVFPLVNIENTGVDLSAWNRMSYYTYLLTRPNTDTDELEAQIHDHIQPFLEEDSSINKIFLQPFEKIYLYSKFSYDVNDLGNIDTVMIFLAIGLLILLIASINFINLSTAQFSRRIPEVAIKKVAGADRKSLLIQYTGESILMALIAGILSIGIVELVLPLFNSYIGEEFRVGMIYSHPVPLIFSATVLLTGLLAGLYPAFFLSSLKPVKLLRSKQCRPGKQGLRKALVIVQFFFSSALITCSIIVLNQLVFINSSDYGYDIDQGLMIPLHGDTKDNFQELQRVLENLPGVESVTVARENPTHTRSAVVGFRWLEDDYKIAQVIYTMRSNYGIVETMGLELTAGEDFSKKAGHRAGRHFILNETAAKSFPGESAVGQRIILNEDTGEVVGIVKDFHHQSFREVPGPLVISIAANDHNYLLLRAESATALHEDVMKRIAKEWPKIQPQQPLEMKPLISENLRLYEKDIRMMAIFMHFTFLAILIAIIGLLGLATYMTNYRFKEIAIRKVLGASGSGLLVMLIKEYFWLILMANVLAAPLAWYAMSVWLESFHYVEGIRALPFIMSLIITLLLGLSAVFVRTRKAVRKSPVDALKYE